MSRVLYQLSVAPLLGEPVVSRPRASHYIVRDKARRALQADPTAVVSIILVAPTKRASRVVVQRGADVIGAERGLSRAKAAEIVAAIVAQHPEELPVILPFVDATPANDDLESALRASLR